MDEQCVFAAMFGASGNIGSTLNIMPGVYRRIHECCANGHFGEALDLQLRACVVMRVLQSFGYPGALREALRMLGLDCGDPRLPWLPLPHDKRQSLHDAIEETDFSMLTAM